VLHQLKTGVAADGSLYSFQQLAHVIRFNFCPGAFLLFSLGCDVAYGFLHQIPSKDQIEPNTNTTMPSPSIPTTSSATEPSAQAATPEPTPAPVIEPVPLISTLHTNGLPPKPQQNGNLPKSTPSKSDPRSPAAIQSAAPVIYCDSTLKLASPLPKTSSNATTNFLLNLETTEYLD